MPRQLRIQHDGAIYHLMSRGDRREEIFRDDLDREDFLKTWAQPAKNWVAGPRLTEGGGPHLSEAPARRVGDMVFKKTA
jgi:hypothetical protein